MSIFSPWIDQLIDMALLEDLNAGDVTSDELFTSKDQSEAILIAKAPCILAGAPIFKRVMEKVSQLPGAEGKVQVNFLKSDGSALQRGEKIAELLGPTLLLLRGERLALNFLQRMSGIATLTHQFVEVAGPELAIVDTRKTTPGLRELEKYAVRKGGGRNHRFHLGSGVMLKDNHIQAAGGIAQAIARIRAHVPHPLKIEVETSTLAEVKEAVEHGADIVMLDNMSIEAMREAIQWIQGRALVEVSGQVTLEKLEALKDMGIDVISSGALTHSYTSADISMKFLNTESQT